MLMITLKQIKAARPCSEGWSAILKLRGPNADHDEPFPLVAALQSNPVEHVVWALRCVPNGKEVAVRYALGCAEMVRHFMSDVRSTAALDAVATYLADGTPVGSAAARAADAAARAAAYAARAAYAAAAYAAADAADAARAARAADAAAAYAAAAYAAADAADAADADAADAAAAYAAHAADAATGSISNEQTALLSSLLS